MSQNSSRAIVACFKSVTLNKASISLCHILKVFYLAITTANYHITVLEQPALKFFTGM